jgi:hypothetical protein
MKRESITASGRMNGRVWKGNTHNCPAKTNVKSHPSAIFGTHKAQYWDIINEGTTINSGHYC